MLRRRFIQFGAVLCAAVGMLAIGGRNRHRRSATTICRARSVSASATATGPGIIRAWCSARRPAGLLRDERGAARRARRNRRTPAMAGTANAARWTAKPGSTSRRCCPPPGPEPMRRRPAAMRPQILR